MTMKHVFKHIFLFPLILLLMVGCHHNGTPTSEATVAKADTGIFVALFNELTFDSLYLVSNLDSFANKDCFMSGVPLDTIYKSLLPDTVAEFINFHLGEDQQYAVGRFQLDDYHEGYLIRHHGEESPSQITLLVYDKKLKKFLGEKLMVAENWETRARRRSSAVC